MYTIENIKDWIDDKQDEINSFLYNYEKEMRQSNSDILDISEFESNAIIAQLWLEEKLEKLGATEKQIENIQKAHWAKSETEDTFKWAIEYVNVFELMKPLY